MTEKRLQDIGEFGLIAKIRNWMDVSRSDLIRGIGDDAAVVESGKKALLITTDILIEDIHFERSWTDPFRLGKKALAVNLSDIAAMGGIPKYFLISIGLPKHLSFSFISLFYRGLKDAARRFGVDLIGGDTSLSRKIIINICLIGEGKKGNLLFRNGAKIGDDLYVSGTLGDAALGLKVLQDKRLRKKPKGLVERHLSPVPRIELGQALAGKRFASAMIDVSDGLLSDTLHIIEESKVGARIWEDRIPLSGPYRRWVSTYSKDPYRIALSGGEDYELLFTASPKRKAGILSLARSLAIPITHVGEIIPEKERLHLIRKDGKEISPRRFGFDHFK
ncbi:MAG: thiamine-phosphate kinase [Deltaproteobacteria bacterium RBG_16_49_23]|nr:MAG: thiamine-phosphate kinase [Deltaproteobacteria bacterium RBG_16_49_23]